MTTPSTTAPHRFAEQHLNVLAWYHTHGRHHLPWRNTADPYAIYLSETMLQQTQVATVAHNYYPRFLQHFPTLQHLADATLEEVLTQWQGLGYYRRAKHLHHTAQACAPQLPSTVAELITLKGIGRNTAHAIMAFAHRQPVAIMEANVKRILTRIHAQTHPTDTQLWEQAHALLDSDHPFEWNQAMMDIGAMICTPKTPQCSHCPLASICAGKEDPQQYPAPKLRKKTPLRHAYIIIARDAGNDKLHMLPRQSEFLHGLYGFLEVEHAQQYIQLSHTEATITSLQPLGQIKQVYSHFTLHAHVWLWNLTSENAPLSNAWYTYAEALMLPMSRADSKALQLFLQSQAASV